MLRRFDYGDYDLILTFFTLKRGKISTIAKGAKKSKKRFAGILEPFSLLEVVCHTGRRKGLPVLQEATIALPFDRIRSDITKTAYASYWAELVNEWMEQGVKQAQVYHLLKHVLKELDMGKISDEALSILFQMRFMIIGGFEPNLSVCSSCRKKIENMNDKISFDLLKGGLLCHKCASGSSGKIFIAKGTIKQLQWIEQSDLKKAKRIRFTHQAITESLNLLEAFVPYHLGKELKSLKFLRQIRGQGLRK